MESRVENSNLHYDLTRSCCVNRLGGVFTDPDIRVAKALVWTITMAEIANENSLHSYRSTHVNLNFLTPIAYYGK